MNLVMSRLDVKTHLLERQHDLATHVFAEIDRRQVEIAAGVVRLGRRRALTPLKEKEFRLGPGIHHVAFAGSEGNGSFQHRPGAAPERCAVRVRDVSAPSGIVWHGAGYFGRRPTFDSDRLYAEAFLFDFEGDLYGRTLTVSFMDFIRADRRFDSIDDLITQMNADCNEARLRLDAIAASDPVAQFPLGKLQAQGLL